MYRATHICIEQSDVRSWATHEPRLRLDKLHWLWNQASMVFSVPIQKNALSTPWQQTLTKILISGLTQNFVTADINTNTHKADVWIDFMYHYTLGNFDISYRFSLAFNPGLFLRYLVSARWEHVLHIQVPSGLLVSAGRVLPTRCSEQSNIMQGICVCVHM
jgi:hypothetical protein